MKCREKRSLWIHHSAISNSKLNMQNNLNVTEIDLRAVNAVSVVYTKIIRMTQGGVKAPCVVTQWVNVILTEKENIFGNIKAKPPQTQYLLAKGFTSFVLLAADVIANARVVVMEMSRGEIKDFGFQFNSNSGS